MNFELLYILLPMFTFNIGLIVACVGKGWEKADWILVAALVISIAFVSVAALTGD